MKKIVTFSDTHSISLPHVKWPEGDILVCAGDFTNIGKLGDVYKFNKLLRERNYKDKIFIAGNHDWYFYHQATHASSIVSNGIYLQDRAITIQGIKFYGTPWQPIFNDWAFNADDEVRFRKFERIPDDTEVLITHAPPYGILDKNSEDDRVGDMVLLKRVLNLQKLKVHIFGHIHESPGVFREGGIVFANVSWRPGRLVMELEI